MLSLPLTEVWDMGTLGVISSMSYIISYQGRVNVAFHVCEIRHLLRFQCDEPQCNTKQISEINDILLFFLSFPTLLTFVPLLFLLQYSFLFLLIYLHITPSVKRNITSSERHSLKSKASKWIIFVHRLLVVLLIKAFLSTSEKNKGLPESKMRNM